MRVEYAIADALFAEHQVQAWITEAFGPSKGRMGHNTPWYVGRQPGMTLTYLSIYHQDNAAYFKLTFCDIITSEQIFPKDEPYQSEYFMKRFK